MIREELVMVCYCDIAGQTRGKGFPLAQLESRLQSGVGWTPTNLQLTAFGPIAESPWGPFGDLLLKPDPQTEVRIDFADGGAVEHFFLADVVETDGRPWDCCPRDFLRRALAALEGEFGLRVLASFEQEFYCYGAEERPGSAYNLDAIRRHGAFAEVFLAALRAAGLECDSYLPEFGPRQYEVTLEPAMGVAAADQAVILREVARASARRLGTRISFAPLVTPEIVGNGTHMHFSLLDRDGAPAAYDAERPHGLSATAGSFVAGVLRHAAALCAMTAAGVVSYGRLVPHRWSAAWSNLGYRDREAMVRICPLNALSARPPARQFNLEYRAADATANPYLALGALVRAGLAGLRDELPAPEATTVDPETLDEAERARRGIRRLPQSLEAALDALEGDALARAWLPEPLAHAYLMHKRAEIAILRDLDHAERCARYAEAY